MRTAILSAALLAMISIHPGRTTGETPVKKSLPPASAAAAQNSLSAEGAANSVASRTNADLDRNPLGAYGIKGPLLVISKQGSVNTATLSNPSLTNFAGKNYLTGVSVISKFTGTSFPGKKVWIPVDDVCQLVELSEKDLEVK